MSAITFSFSSGIVPPQLAAAAPGQVLEAQQIVGGGERRLRALPRRDDDLLVGHARHVPGGEEPGDGGAAGAVDLDLAARVQRRQPRTGSLFGISPISTKTPSRAISSSAPPRRARPDRAHPFLAEDLGHRGPQAHLDLRQGADPTLEDLVAREPVQVLEDDDPRGDLRQVERRLEPGVAAADHADDLAAEQRRVADRAGRHPPAEQALLARHAEQPRPLAGGDEQRPRLVVGAAGAHHEPSVAPLGSRHLEAEAEVRGELARPARGSAATSAAPSMSR